MLKHIADCLVPDAFGGDCEPRRASLCNAVSIGTVFTGTDSIIRTVTATADADTTATIPHGMAAAPAEVQILPLLQAPAGVSLWAVTTIDATNVVCTKSTGVGSGNAGAQLRVTIKTPHSLGR